MPYHLLLRSTHHFCHLIYLHQFLRTQNLAKPLGRANIRGRERTKRSSLLKPQPLISQIMLILTLIEVSKSTFFNFCSYYASWCITCKRIVLAIRKMTIKIYYILQFEGLYYKNYTATYTTKLVNDIKGD